MHLSFCNYCIVFIQHSSRLKNNSTFCSTAPPRTHLKCTQPAFAPPPGIEAEPASGGVSDHGRGSGCSSSAPARMAPVVRTVCYIAAELVRLVSCVESMKPVLQSLYHRILLYPPPQHRTEAIRIMKEVGGARGWGESGLAAAAEDDNDRQH